MRPTTEIWLVNYATNEKNAGVSAAFPNPVFFNLFCITDHFMQ